MNGILDKIQAAVNTEHDAAGNSGIDFNDVILPGPIPDHLE